jgi:hypothetical protein
MKKFIYLTVLLVLLLLAGCGSPEPAVEDTAVPDAGEPSVPAATEPAAEVEPTAAPTEAAADTGTEPQVEPTAKPTPIQISFGGKAVYTRLYFEDFETYTADSSSGFETGGGIVELTTDPEQVVDGSTSLLLAESGRLKSNPGILPLAANTEYIIEFDYRVLERDSEKDIAYLMAYPTGSYEYEDSLSSLNFAKNADKVGSYATSIRTGDEEEYWMQIGVLGDASLVIDNLAVIRIDTQPLTTRPEHWESMDDLPYPRLGNFAVGTPYGMAWGQGGEPELTYSVNQIERRLAMADVIVGFSIANQTWDPALTYRLRSLNPDIIIVPITLPQEHVIMDQFTGGNSTVLIDWNFQEGLADEWFVYDTAGNIVEDYDWPGIRKMNISEFCPVVEGQTFNDYLIDWVINDIMASGIWDGIIFDNLFGAINPHIPNFYNPAALDFDINRNGERDETPAMISDITRQSVTQMLQNLRDEVGNYEIIMGNNGSYPNIYAAPLVNGYVFECVNWGWYTPYENMWEGLHYSEPGFRQRLEAYFLMQAEAVKPVTNIMQGCGKYRIDSIIDTVSLEPTEQDIRNQRLTLGLTLLSDGFYEYDLYDNRSAPFWFDEYTVNADGVAEEDLQNKGYLGMPLGNAVELKSPVTPVLEEDFEAGFPAYMLSSTANTYTSTDPADAISGEASLIIDNPDHSQIAYYKVETSPSEVVLDPNTTYLVEFDWKILETLDDKFTAYIWDGINNTPEYWMPGVVAGDSGHAIFPITTGSRSGYRLTLQLMNGGGRVAIDNLTIMQGGVGPWRRDFENGFVLVNPIHQPYTFSLEELAGEFGRTGIKRILGTQAPDVNNGQEQTEEFTLQPFDAIIFLADHVSQE